LRGMRLENAPHWVLIILTERRAAVISDFHRDPVTCLKKRI
jgi:hypothetical protein